MRLNSAGIRFWKVYVSTFLYDEMAKNHPYQELVRQSAGLVVGNNPAGHYLEIGCGTGNATAAIQSLLIGGSVVGVDNSEAALARARKKFPQIDFLPADMNSRLPFADGSFDGVLANNSLYLVADPQKTIEEGLRVLKVGGHFVMSNPDQNSSSLAIFRAHLAKQWQIYVSKYGVSLATVLFALHLEKAFLTYGLILPFELALKHGEESLESRFWAAERWLSMLSELQGSTRYHFGVFGPIPSYAGENHTIGLLRTE